MQPDWEAVIEAVEAPRRRRRVRLTRRQLWIEYRDEARARGGTAYSYSQFCARLKARLKDRAGETEMRFDYAPGLWGLSDFSGKTLALRTGRGARDVQYRPVRCAQPPHLGPEHHRAQYLEGAVGRAGPLITVFNDLLGTRRTLWWRWRFRCRKESRDYRSGHYSSVQPLRSCRKQSRLRWNTATWARAKPTGPEPISRLLRYRAQSPSFSTRQ